MISFRRIVKGFITIISCVLFTKDVNFLDIVKNDTSSNIQYFATETALAMNKREISRYNFKKDYSLDLRLIDWLYCHVKYAVCPTIRN